MPGCWILSLHLLFQLNNNLVKNKIMKKGVSGFSWLVSFLLSV